MQPEHPDDHIPTAAAIGSLAFIATMIIHEGFGHGGVCAAIGGRIVLYPVSMQSNIDSRLMVAAGPLANLLAGAALWLLLTRSTRISTHLRYFLWLTAAFNLFNAAGYAGLGALTGFGDWGVLLRWTRLPWVFRIGVALLAGILYYVFMRALAFAAGGFLGKRLVLAPYLAAGITAILAASLSRLGVGYLAVAAAASLGAGWGLLVIHDWGQASRRPFSAARLSRSNGWIFGSLVATIAFVVLIGRGLTMGR